MPGVISVVAKTLMLRIYGGSVDSLLRGATPPIKRLAEPRGWGMAQ